MRRAKQMICLLFLLVLRGNETLHAQIAIVANKEFPLQHLSVKEVKKIFMGRRTTFEKEGAIFLAEYLPLTEKFCRKALRTSTARYRKHWIQIVFSGGSAAPPKSFKSAEELKSFLRRNRTAIGYLDWEEVDDSIRVIPVDGKVPTDPKYFLNR